MTEHDRQAGHALPSNDADLDGALAGAVGDQRLSDWDYADMFDIPEDIVLQGGRPVLIVPNAGDLKLVGSRILVAWNGKREGARAVFDALPLLQKAQDVRVLWIDPQNEAIGPSDIATAEICAALARHGVRCEDAHSKTDRVEVDQELLRQTGEHHSDLLVMGCYGRSRLREFILGGATRHVLHNMSIPSHVPLNVEMARRNCGCEVLLNQNALGLQG